VGPCTLSVRWEYIDSLYIRLKKEISFVSIINRAQKKRRNESDYFVGRCSLELVDNICCFREAYSFHYQCEICMISWDVSQYLSDIMMQYHRRKTSF
jgi:hypothetical protein